MSKQENQAAEELKKMRPSLIAYNAAALLVITVSGFFFGFDWRNYTGLLAGNVLCVANFLLIGYTAGAITKTRNASRGQFIGNFSYGARYIGMFVILALLAMFELISVITAVVPLFYIRLYYTVKALRSGYDDD